MARRLLRWLGRGALGLLACAGVLVLLSFALRQPPNGMLRAGETTGLAILVVDHGHHAGLVLPRRELLEAANREGLGRLAKMLDVFEPFAWVETGWGEENFYRNVPRAELASAHHVLRALFLPGNASVLHVVGLDGDPRRVFSGSDLLDIKLPADGFARIAREIDRQLADPEATPLGPGLYGPSAFFAARDAYHLFNTCNHWVGRTLAEAGMAYAPVESTFSAGLLWSLRARRP